MKDYNYTEKWKKIITPEIVLLLTQIHEFKGEQNLHISQKPEELKELMVLAKIQSTEYSNKIEGIYTSDERLKSIALDKTVPTTRDEEEIAGYRDVLNTIHESHDFIPIRPTYINQLHRDLYKFSAVSFGGNYKSSDNIIQEEDVDGNKKIRFKPIPAWETSEAMQKLCDAYNDIINSGKSDPLIIMPMFIIDFLCIHPYNDGNGRMSRLLTLLLLYKSEYIVGKYISIEKIIESSKTTYYETLQKSSIGWHENNNNYEIFVKYYLGVVLNAYKEFSNRITILIDKDAKKVDIVEDFIKNKLGYVTKQDVLDNCLSVSDTSVQRALKKLQNESKIEKIGNGRYTKYQWIRE